MDVYIFETYSHSHASLAGVARLGRDHGKVIRYQEEAEYGAGYRSVLADHSLG